MSLKLTGEDGLTLSVLAIKKYLEEIKNDLNLKIIEDIWFRPSFGRGAGPKRNPEEKGYSGFGESDAMIIGVDENENTKIVFLESKFGEFINSEKNKRDLRYQFYLKMALIYSILKGSVKKSMGKQEEEKEYYCIELKNKESDVNKKEISGKLEKYYNEYKNQDEDSRNNGWMISKESKSPPALNAIEKKIKEMQQNLKFSFYALGFTTNEESKGIIENLFDDILELPEDLLIEKIIQIKYRTFAIKDNVMEFELPVLK